MSATAAIVNPRVTAALRPGLAREHASVRQRDPHQQAAGLAAAQRAEHDGDRLIRLHVVELPAALHEDARAAQFDGPVFRRIGAVRDVDLDVGMRVRPLELRHLAGERHRLGRVEHRKRVMRVQTRRAAQRQHSRQTQGYP
jgi:hypothetical protein